MSRIGEREETPDLRLYQAAGILRAAEAFHRGQPAFYIADEMGLGKTAQALRIAEILAEPGELVRVICPAFLAPKWRAEADRWSPDRKYTLAITPYTQTTSAEKLRFLTRRESALLILDEAHYLKEYDAIRTRAILGAPGDRHRTLISTARHSLWLSGTPAPNRVGELYPFLKVCNHKLIQGKTYEEFVTAWAAEYRFSRFGLRHKGVKRARTLRAALSDVMIRRLRADVIEDLPPFTRDFVPVEMSEAIAAQEKSFAPFLSRLIDSPDVALAALRSMPGFTEFQEFRRMIGHFKVPIIEQFLLTEDMKRAKKFVIFSIHKDVAAEYAERLKARRPILVTGDTDPRQRYAVLKKANESPEAVVVATMESVKEGLDLDGFPIAVFSEIGWTPGLLRQVEGRLLRMTQRAAVQFFYFTFPEGLERYMFSTIEEKEETTAAFLPGE